MSLLRHGPFGRMRFGAAGASPVTGHFVSPDGNASWAQATSIDNPCSPATAFANAVAGDMVYFRSGTYNAPAGTFGSPCAPAWQPSNSGTSGNRITFRNYPSELPIINAHASTQGDGELLDHCFGVVSHDYITFDGLKLIGDSGAAMGGVYLWHATGIILRNLTIDGGTTSQTTVNNCDCIRVEYCTDYTISRCKIHRFNQVDGWANTAAIKLYHNKASSGVAYGYDDVLGGGLIEHCELYDGVTAIYVKSSSDGLAIRSCFIHDAQKGIHVTPSLEAMESDGGEVSGNLIVNIAEAGFDADNDNTAYHGNDWSVFQNTFYGCFAAFNFSAADAGHGWVYYNNVSDGMTDAHDLSGQTAGARLKAEDHNQWGASAGWEMGRNDVYHRYASLAEWQASTELDGGGHPGSGDLASDPQFANVSGTLTLASDFALGAGSPCRGAGRDGVDMGCDVTQVGVV